MFVLSTPSSPSSVMSPALFLVSDDLTSVDELIPLANAIAVDGPFDAVSTPPHPGEGRFNVCVEILVVVVVVAKHPNDVGGVDGTVQYRHPSHLSSNSLPCRPKLMPQCVTSPK